MPVIKRRKPRAQVAAQAPQETPREAIPAPAMPKAPAIALPLVGSLRAELVEFARAQRRVEKLRMRYQAKLAKLDQIHMRNWWKLSRRLILAQAATKSNGNGV